MIKVGNREVLFNTSVLVQDDETALIDTPIGNGTLKIAIGFPPLPAGEQPSFAFRTENGVLDLKFVGWKSPLGTVLAVPPKFGDIDQRPLRIQVAHYYTGGYNHVHIWIYLDGPNG